MYKYFFKRLLDIIVSVAVLLLASPVFFIVLISLFIANQGKPFFIQERPGKNEKLFRIIKFKTMNDKKDEEGNLLPDAKRLTKVGGFVRKTSLDELPQLINVFLGDMSLIGPRPLLVRYLPFYKQDERIRHSVRPGITGWAQVNGRNTAKWDDRLALDVVYVKNISFAFDMKIIYRTILKVIKSENIVIDPESIMKNLDDERRY
ncbi:sugar transferase [Sphingobacterium spiritivorum]|uniref:Bacterial sugar transferase n=1 Tax=Sphingobacterium spiritivorum ATCC 33861 TaxID=525373 RepID=D7VI74_SPHSI|nr:sugar transferase [Sphingobacterium spiritivorum]EFK59776.1 bacterial sugar transferase [Sphingobacterium spiritivorum ATCC 33861]QQT37579.1 sugar transferase [Sphingobacterium spiritivorum]WQD34376.1 sugar transferase [Sphingobacterium spiritivorum]SUI97316.1 Putative colanic biosynthesis UDP-glucose lipid carrier transferase [Sphingobacterium spiritivorum]